MANKLPENRELQTQEPIKWRSVLLLARANLRALTLGAFRVCDPERLTR